MFSGYHATRSIITIHSQLRRLMPLCTLHNKGNIIEVIDNKSLQGNILFTNILANCILPEQQGGCDMHAIYFDLTQNFDLLQLISVLEEKTNAGEEVIKDWMKRFHIVRCRELHQLVITLLSLEPMIANSKSPVKLVIVDGLGCNYWHEQFSGSTSKYLKEHNYRKLINVLKILMEKYGVTILVRTKEMFARKVDGNSGITDHRNLQMFGDAWTDLVTCRYVLVQEQGLKQNFILKNASGNGHVNIETSGPLVL